MEPKWITLEMARAFHQRQIAEHDGQDGLRDQGLLESALSRPQQRFTYGDPPPDLCELAASYAHGLAKNHPFLDGNKHTAFVTFRVFLLLNGLQIVATKEDRYFQVLSFTSSEQSEESFAEWLREVTAPIF